MAGVFDVLKTAEHNQNSAIRPEQETSQDSLFVLVLVTTARIFRSRMKRKFHVRFCIGGGVGNHPTDRNFHREGRTPALPLRCAPGTMWRAVPGNAVRCKCRIFAVRLTFYSGLTNPTRPPESNQS